MAYNALIPVDSLAIADIPSAIRTKGADVKEIIDVHLIDTTAAHAASAIAVTPTGKITATDAQAAMAKLDNAIPYHGLVNRTDSTLVWTNTSPDRTLTITGTFTYYYQGIERVISASPAVQITNTAGLWFFYFNTAGTLTASKSFPSMYTSVIVAMLFWNGTAGILYDERHGYQRNIDWHINAHTTIGSRYGAGIDFSFAGTAGTTTFATTSGNIWDEDINFTVDAQTTAFIFYRTGASTYTFDSTPSTKPYKWNSGTSKVQYVNSGTYALTDCAANRYVNVWIYGSNSLTNPIMCVADFISTSYSQVSDARAASPPSLSAMGLSPELKLLYRIVVSGDGTIQTLTTADDFRNSSSLPAGGSASTTAAAVAFTPSAAKPQTNVQAAIDAIPSPIVMAIIFG